MNEFLWIQIAVVAGFAIGCVYVVVALGRLRKRWAALFLGMLLVHSAAYPALSGFRGPGTPRPNRVLSPPRRTAGGNLPDLNPGGQSGPAPDTDHAIDIAVRMAQPRVEFTSEDLVAAQQKVDDAAKKLTDTFQRQTEGLGDVKLPKISFGNLSGTIGKFPACAASSRSIRLAIGSAS